MKAESLNIPYRYLSTDGEIETGIKKIKLNQSKKQAKVQLSLPGSEKSSLEMDIAADPMEPVGYLPEFSEDELKRRLPEIQYINNKDLHKKVIDILLNEFPDHYWTYPASTSGKHHPIDERTFHGQWIHTKRVISAFKYISESPRKTATKDNAPNQFSISKYEKECSLAAALIHDIFKFGDSIDNKNTLDDHDVIAAEYLSKEYDLPDTTLNCIEAHNGPWRDGKHPKSLVESLLHYSDMMVTDIQNERLLLEPTKELILSKLIQELRHGVKCGDQYTIQLTELTV
jgi:hypothetical protein